MGVVARVQDDGETMGVVARLQDWRRRLTRAWTALLAPPTLPGPIGLPVEQLRRLGALTLQEDRSEAVEHYIMEQRFIYEHASKEDLVWTLLARDRQLLIEGKRLADGTVGHRVLREFMRASLYASEGKANPQMVERVLQTLSPGMEQADARQLKLHGSTLGSVGEP